MACALAAVGCFANVTTTKITHKPDGSIVIDSGKDVKIGSLHFHEGAAQLDVADYSSNANAAVVDAQTAREQAQFQGINSILSTAINAAVTAAAKSAKP